MRTQRHECPRCHGMMVEAYSDLVSPDSAGNDMIGWRCINCGEYVDRLVLLNRWAQQGVPPPPSGGGGTIPVGDVVAYFDPSATHSAYK